LTIDPRAAALALHPGKFEHPDWTAKGEARATVPFVRLETLWINTGTLCNITCRNCYIESSPVNDRLVYLTLAETLPFLDEARALGTREIGFTGGEPFMNPDFLAMARAALERGFEVLALTNAMAPMRRPAVERDLLALQRDFGAALAIRVSLDHHGAERHDAERGAGAFKKAADGIDWLASAGFHVSIAGRSCWGESEDAARQGFGRLIAGRGWPIDARDKKQLVIFPEMTGGRDVPEITERCWDILHIRPESLMCASARMVVKRKGAARPAVLPCTLLPYDPAFEMGGTLAGAANADGGMFAKGAVKLRHPHCAAFCVLGGGSCS